MRPKTDKDIDIMREAGHILANLLDQLKSQALPGITTKELSDQFARACKGAGVRSAVQGYQGFPEAMCTSLNDAVVHGIPNNKPLKQGDLLKLDIVIQHKGLLVDSATTVYVGQPDSMPADIKRLLEGSQKALMAGVDAIKGAGTRVGDISSAIQAVLEEYQLGIVRDLVGHGIGYDMHEDPNVPNYGIAGTGQILRAGTTIAVEPMATLGGYEVNILDDGWTVVTRDGSLAAHFEHTVLVNENGAEILTN